MGDEPPGRMASEHGWVLSTRTLDSAGHVLSSGGTVRDDVVIRLCHRNVADITKFDLDACGRELGLHNVVRVIPPDRFWVLQAWEAAIFGGLALVLVGFTFWWVRRRIG